jgi:hypothetical protein
MFLPLLFVVRCSLHWRRSDLIGRALRCSAQNSAIVKIVGVVVKIVKENMDGTPALSNESVIATAKR